MTTDRKPHRKFVAWERRHGLSRAVDTARMLGVSRQTVHDLRAGRSDISPPMRRLMDVLDLCRERGIEVPPAA